MRLPRPSRHSTRAQARALSAYWDEVARRAPADPVPPAELDRGLATTVRHLTALPVDAVPDPRFAARLLDRIAPVSQERPTMSTASPMSPGHVATRSTDRTSRAASQPLGVAVPSPRRWSAVAIAAVAAAAAAGSSAATPASDSANLPVTADSRNDLFFTGVVDLSGPGRSAWLWVVPVVPDASVRPPIGVPHLVMPLTGGLVDRVSGATLHPGQAFSPTAADRWELANDSDAAIDVLILTGSDEPPNVVTDPPTDYRTSPLGKLSFDAAYDTALLEVTRVIGPEGTTVIDTGRDGIAVIRADHSPTIVDILAGEGAVYRYSADGTQSPGYESGFVPTDQEAATVFLAEGDLLTITGGAAASLRGDGSNPIPALVVTIRFDSARLQSIQPGVMVMPATTNAAGTPVAPNGCGIGRWTEDELRSRLATPAAGPLPSLGFGLADGVPADDETVADIDAAADRLAVCVRTNDPLRYSRLWSADGLRFLYSVADLDEDLAMEVLPEGAGPYRPRATVQDVRVHPDGRVSAVVDLDGEIAYVVWVREDGVWLVELFNDAIFAGTLADGSRCATVPLDPAELAALAPATLTPAALSPDGGLDISSPTESPPPAVNPRAPDAVVASEAVGRVFDCLVTLDPARVYALATDAFRAQWAGVAGGLVPLGEPRTSAATRFPLAVATVYRVDALEGEPGGGRRIGVLLTGSTASYVVLVEVDGEWLVDGWAPL